MQMIEHGPFYSPIGTEFLNNTRYICIDGFSILQTLPALIDQETPPATSDTCQSKPIASATLKRQNGKKHPCEGEILHLSNAEQAVQFKFQKSYTSVMINFYFYQPTAVSSQMAEYESVFLFLKTFSTG
ncbi:hypothetical protein Tsp_10379 [Trichinella spiralis]|uniref:hypothetical protein n=1 Tax=Trichinella spiralis TaxID=6334 RepID=UPI0001EFEA9A|nr:hypothetical protein Tsp_10379 [Trichinella spiralis]